MTTEERERLKYRLAAELDRPSVYMGGPSQQSLRVAERLMWIIEEEAARHE